MRIRRGAPLVLLASLGACVEQGSNPVTAPSVALSATTFGTIEVPRAIADAGCSVGQASSMSTSRVIMVPRALLPFRLPALERMASSANQRASFKVQRFGVPAEGGQLLVACIVPLRSDATAIATAVRTVAPGVWKELSRQIAAQQSIAQSVDQAVGIVLRAKTFPAAKRVERKGAGERNVSASLSLGGCPGCPPQYLQGITVTAGYNYSMIDHWVISGLFSWYGERPPPYVDWYLENQWAQQCEDYNEAYWTWYNTKDQVAANANEVANDLEALADLMEVAVLELETAENSCERVAGKPLCIDFFIMNCSLLLMEGDCRGFDEDAKFSKSRVQMYLNPESRQLEVKYNCSRFVVRNTPVYSECDSSRVFNPDRDVTPSWGTDAFTIRMSFMNNVCASIRGVCPSIDATLSFSRDAAAPGGWHVTWSRDGFPSMGVYSRNAADTGYDTVVEDPQKTRKGLQALRALAGEIRSTGSNVPQPENPNNCTLT